MLYTLLCIALLLYLVPLVIYGAMLLVMGTAIGTVTLVEATGQTASRVGRVLLYPFRHVGPWFDYAITGGLLAAMLCGALLYLASLQG